jgi:DNA-binding PucR family transcriptional regulator
VPRSASVSRGDGLTGFRETHEQAQEALDTALRIGRPLARYGSVALISVLSSHPERARRMMRWYLGPLAGDTPANDRLRETLRMLLDTHLNQREAARRMGVHAHTVGYRLQRIEELLGCPVTERAIELHAALAIYDTLPSST